MRSSDQTDARISDICAVSAVRGGGCLLVIAGLTGGGERHGPARLDQLLVNVAVQVGERGVHQHQLQLHHRLPRLQVQPRLLDERDEGLVGHPVAEPDGVLGPPVHLGRPDVGQPSRDGLV